MYSAYPNLTEIEKNFESSAFDTLGIDTNLVKYTEFSVDVFPQVWSSTALGFGGFGGQAITRAYTTVIVMDYIIEDNQRDSVYGVYFSDKLAYIIEKPTKQFYRDLEGRDMKPVSMSYFYRE